MTEDQDTDAEQETLPDLEPPIKIAGSSLLSAAWFRRLKLTKLLVLGGEPLNEANDDGQTPLMVALLSTHADNTAATHAQMVHYLLEQGADACAVDKHGQTALTHACKERRCAEVLRALLAAGSDPARQDRFGRSALHISAQLGGDGEEALELMARHCKAHGKEVIIVTKRTAVVAPCLKDDAPRIRVTVQSAAVPPIVVKTPLARRPQSELTLPVPLPADLDCSRTRGGFGSPRPRTKFSHSPPEAGEGGERRASFTLSVKPIAEVNDTWIPREAVEPPPGDVTQAWGDEDRKPPPSRRRLVRRATTHAINPVPPLPPPHALRDGLAGPADLSQVKTDLLRWEKELAARGFPKREAGGARVPEPRLGTCGATLPAVTGLSGGRLGTKVSVSRDNAISSGDEEGEEAALPALQRSRRVGARGRVLERKGSAQQLLDHVSQTRPGTLPPLNAPATRPIPQIPTGAGEQEAAEDGQPDAEGLTPHQRLLAMNPKRRFFNRRSNTIEIGDTSKLLALNRNLADYRRRAACHVIAQSSKEGEA